MSGHRRVLLTARSACAAWGMVEIWRAMRSLPDLELRVLAQEPALQILRAEAVPCVDVGLPPATSVDSDEATRLLAYAEAELGRFRPDAILTGLSIPEGGIDEAVIFKAGCPSFVLQDFWGDCNLFFGRHADRYLATDRHGAELTARLHGAKAIAVGSPRHVRYAGIDFEAMRSEVLEKHGLDPSGLYPGFFTQPLFKFPGYLATLDAWAGAVSRRGRAKSVILRPHPACSSQETGLAFDLIADRGLTPVTILDGPVERVIAACSSIASAISNTNFDAVYVNYFARSPMAVPLYLLWEEDLIGYLGRFQDLDAMPLAKWGMALSVRYRDDLEKILGEAAEAATRGAIWRSASQMPDPAAAIDAVIEILKRPERVLSGSSLRG